MTALNVAEFGSFRDPAGRVFMAEGRVFRAISPVGAEAFRAAQAAGIFDKYCGQGRLIGHRELPREDWPKGAHDAAIVLEHEMIPYVSYPYEWSFGQLKQAALHHLDLQIDLFDEGFVLSDATAYNIQYVGANPVFIDTLSIRPYVDQEYWIGHRQFCEQFLNPLLLRAKRGIPHNSWFRGNLEGIPTLDISRLLTLRDKWSWNVLSQVTLQASLEARAISQPDRAVNAVRRRGLPAAAYKALLIQLRSWIARLLPAGMSKTVWGDYATDNTYSDAETAAKGKVVSDFAARHKPGTLIDLGCNTGAFSQIAIEAGAGSVVGFDFDQQAVDKAFVRARTGGLPFLPLWLDAANPSPSQGWAQAERKGFKERFTADAVIALAFEHHLVIGRNVPMDQVVAWIVRIAPRGIIEFVPKNDPTVVQMLALREDIFPDYSLETFERALGQLARIVDRQTVSASGRMMIEFERL